MEWNEKNWRALKEANRTAEVSPDFKIQLKPQGEFLLGLTDRAKSIPPCSDSSLHSCLTHGSESTGGITKSLEISGPQEIWEKLEMKVEYRNMLQIE